MNQAAPYSLSEEIANAISHGLGALLSVAGLTLLVTYAVIAQDVLRITSFTIYGVSLVLLFLSSTLYHALTNKHTKTLFKLFDHCAIYLLIAGTYTPLLLISLKGVLGYALLAIIWLLAIAGIVFKICFRDRYKVVSLITYIGMGLMSLTIIHRLYQALPTAGLTLLATGGAVYLLGVFFYVNKNIPYNHAIWHLFVLGGASCHFFMMWFYI